MVGGSNPSTPTVENQALTINFVGAFFMLTHTIHIQLSVLFDFWA